MTFSAHQVNPVLKKCLEEQGLKFVGQDVEGERMEIVELEGECLGSYNSGEKVQPGFLDVWEKRKICLPRPHLFHLLHRILTIPSDFVLQIIHSLLGYSTTLSSCPGLSSPPHPTLASFWPLWGDSHITFRKVAGSHPGGDTNSSQ